MDARYARVYRLGGRLARYARLLLACWRATRAYTRESRAESRVRDQGGREPRREPRRELCKEPRRHNVAR